MRVVLFQNPQNNFDNGRLHSLMQKGTHPKNILKNANIKSQNTIIERNYFLKKIEGNEEALRMLSIDRLKILEKYYDNVIEQNNEK